MSSRVDKERYRNIIKGITEATCWELVWELLSRPWRRIIRFCWLWLWSCGRPVNNSRDKSSESSSESFIQEHEEQLLEIKDENQQLQKALDQAQDDYNQLKHQMVTMVSSYERKIENMQYEHSVGIATLRSEKDEMKRAKEDALSRLSDLMGSKLRDNNPAITDLNDPNRPMKLGDQFSQIYENDWTDAFIALTEQRNEDESTKYDEESAIALLLRLIMEIDEKCGETSRIQLAGMIKSTENFSRDEVSDYIKAAKDSHKVNALKYLPLIMQELTSEKSVCETVVKYVHLQECRCFIDNCIKFCYLAAVQDPPMYLSFETGKDFNRQVFKEYTASGSKVKFLVWPALFLHRGGPLLSKGVVQPMENTTEDESTENITDVKPVEDTQDIEPIELYAHDVEHNKNTQNTHDEEPNESAHDVNPYKNTTGVKTIENTSEVQTKENESKVQTKENTTEVQTKEDATDVVPDENLQIDFKENLLDAGLEEDKINTADFHSKEITHDVQFKEYSPNVQPKENIFQIQPKEDAESDRNTHVKTKEKTPDVQPKESKPQVQHNENAPDAE